MLLDIRQYLIERQRASLQDLALRFDTTPDAMRGMLEIWIKKGKIIKCDAAACEGCSSGCSAEQQNEAYEYNEKPDRAVPLHFVKRKH